MKVDASAAAEMVRIPDEVRKLEQMGYDGIKIAELTHDPFMPLAIAAEHSDRIELVTSVAVAFARNPMIMANLAHDLNAFSGGRFILGLGSQVKPHIERRFSMPWYKPAPQMREFIEAMHAIFDCWYDGVPLDFDGEFYEHTLMPTTFKPTNTDAGRPRIHLSATGPLMTRLAAELADGLILHPFTTEAYLRNVTIPAIDDGLARSGRSRENFEIDFANFIVSGTNEDEFKASMEEVRARIAFYGSTPAYRVVLEQHGWGELQSELNRLNRQSRRTEMAGIVDDEVVHTFAVTGEPREIISKMRNRFGDLVNRTTFRLPFLSDDENADLVRELKSQE